MLVLCPTPCRRPGCDFPRTELPQPIAVVAASPPSTWSKETRIEPPIRSAERNVGPLKGTDLPYHRARATPASRSPTGFFCLGWTFAASPVSTVTARPQFGTVLAVRSSASRSSADLVVARLGPPSLKCRKTGDNEGEISLLAEGGPPIAQSWPGQQRPVLTGTPGVGFALVPYL